MAQEMRAAAHAAWPLWMVALSLNGFFLYLAALDAIDLSPRTGLTAGYYVLLAIVLALATWGRRDLLVDRLRVRTPAGTACLAAAGVLSAWFLLNTALLSDGPLARRLATLLVLWTIPTALVALTTRVSELNVLSGALATVAMLIVPIEALAVARSGDDIFRFTPIADLDVISAGIVPAVGAVGALAFLPRTRNGHVARLACVALLGAATVVPGSRGPVLALAVAVLALFLVQRVRLHAVAVGALVLGMAAGSLVGSSLGSFGYLEPGTERDEAAHLPAWPAQSVSTLSARKHWIEDALREAPDRPLFGHGVGMFVDRTPEAVVLGVDGQRTYPHNTFVEAIHSLGILGLLAFVVFVAAAAASLIGAIRRRGRLDPALALPVGLGAFAFTNTNISGEIATDAILWAAAALAVAVGADLDILKRR